MGFTIRIDKPQLLPHLLDHLTAGGCSAEKVDGDTARVVHGQALDDAEAMTELRFFVRAWARSHAGVSVRLQPEA